MRNVAEKVNFFVGVSPTTDANNIREKINAYKHQVRFVKKCQNGVLKLFANVTALDWKSKHVLIT